MSILKQGKKIYDAVNKTAKEHPIPTSIGTSTAGRVAGDSISRKIHEDKKDGNKKA